MHVNSRYNPPHNCSCEQYIPRYTCIITYHLIRTLYIQLWNAPNNIYTQIKINSHDIYLICDTKSILVHLSYVIPWEHKLITLCTWLQVKSVTWFLECTWLYKYIQWSLPRTTNEFQTTKLSPSIQSGVI